MLNQIDPYCNNRPAESRSFPAKAALLDMRSAAQRLSGKAGRRGAALVCCLLDEVFLQE
jgi:hypothetical protein